MVLIGICGFIGSGKDTIASYLTENKGYHKLSFGAAVKDVVSSVFSLDRHMLECITEEDRQKRETIDEWWSKTLDMPDLSPRVMMVTVATKLFREQFHPDIWTKVVERQLSMQDKIVISDCRFANEICMLKENGGKLIYVKRHEPEWFPDYKNGIDHPEAEKLHISEREWIRSNFDYIIDNDGSIESLIEQLECII